MKRNAILIIFFLLLAFIPYQVSAQLDFSIELTFDPSDTNYKKYVTIDTVSHLHNSWQIGKPGKGVFDAARSWPNAIITDTIHPYPPNDTSIFVIGLSNYVFTTEYWKAISTVQFYYKLDIDTGSKGIFEYSIDTGRTWQVVSNDGSVTPDTTTFTQPAPIWRQYVTYFTGMFSDTLLLRFTFISDSDTATKDGWMIDDLNVYYWTEEVLDTKHRLSNLIYPNPAQSILTICTPDKSENISIFNQFGQLVQSVSSKYSEKQIDVHGLPPGMYIVKTGGIIFGKFQKE